MVGPGQYAPDAAHIDAPCHFKKGSGPLFQQ